MRGGGGGGAKSIVACLTKSFDHPFRSGAPLLLLMQTPQTFGRSLPFFHI